MIAGAGRRLFYALWPDDAIRTDISGASRHAVRECGGRPVPAQNYHLTLAFLGQVPSDRLPALHQAASAITVPAIEITLTRFGYFPRPRIFWIGPDQSPLPLMRIAAELSRGAAALGLELDQRPFRAHLTLARKVTKELNVLPRRPVFWPVCEFVLVESRTESAGVRYTVIERYSAGSSGEPKPV